MHRNLIYEPFQEQELPEFFSSGGGGNCLCPCLLVGGLSSARKRLLRSFSSSSQFLSSF